MNALLRDLRYAARALWRTPLFTLGIIITLALGIGVNATMFGVVDALFLQPPAGVRDPGDVARVYFRRTYAGWGTYTGATTTFPDFENLRDHVPGFAGAAAMTARTMSLGRGADARQVQVAAVSHGYFPLLGVTPAMGRFFDAAEDRAGGERVAVVSWRFWQQRFAGAADVLGTPLQIGKGSYTIVGVAQRGFTGINLKAADVFLPISAAASEIADSTALTTRNWQWMQVVARVRPGVERAAVEAQATPVFRHGVSEEGRTDSTSAVLLGPVQEARGPEARSDAKVSAWIGAVAAIVLLIACANVANLLLARGVGRRRELAVRAGLGAGRGGLLRMLLTESLLLSVLGGGAALVMAAWTGAAVRGFLLPDLPAETPVISPRILLFTGAAVLVTALLAGLVPAVQASRTDLADALKSGGHGATARGGRTRATLLAAQVALTLVLLVGAGLFVRSLRNVEAVNPGFDADKVLSVSVNLDATGMPRPEANATYLRILERLQQLPGVENAAASMGTPFGWAYSTTTRAEGRDSMPHLASGGPYYTEVTPGYFGTMGAQILRGRDFSVGDLADRHVAIVGASFAHKVWPGREALGKCLYIGDDTTTVCTQVVGVVEDVAHGAVTADTSLLYYRPMEPVDKAHVNALFVRSRTSAAAIADAVRREVQAEGNLPYATVESLEDEIVPQQRSWRLGAASFSAFGLLALIIAATGIFAVLSYGVSQRTKEIGVRVALGAREGQVVRMIVGQGLRSSLAGVVLGLGGAYALARAVASLLYGVRATDPVVYASVVVALLTVAVVAAYAPARRAARVDPMLALRSE